MSEFEVPEPILNSPYSRPIRHWELDEHGQPTQAILETRRRAEFITPIPKPKKRKKAAFEPEFIFNEGKDANSGLLDLSAWVSIINQSGATYPETKLKLIAGDVPGRPRPGGS